MAYLLAKGTKVRLKKDVHAITERVTHDAVPEMKHLGGRVGITTSKPLGAHPLIYVVKTGTSEWCYPRQAFTLVR